MVQARHGDRRWSKTWTIDLGKCYDLQPGHYTVHVYYDYWKLNAKPVQFEIKGEDSIVEPRHLGWFAFEEQLLPVQLYEFKDNLVGIGLLIIDPKAKSRDDVIQTGLTVKVWVLTDDGESLERLHKDIPIIPLFSTTGGQANVLYMFEHKPEKAAIAAVVIRMRGQMGLIPMRELERLNLDRDEQDRLDRLNTLPFLEEIGGMPVPPAEVQGLKRNTLIMRNNLLRQLREQEREVIFDPALGRFVIE